MAATQGSSAMAPAWGGGRTGEAAARAEGVGSAPRARAAIEVARAPREAGGARTPLRLEVRGREAGGAVVLAAVWVLLWALFVAGVVEPSARLAAARGEGDRVSGAAAASAPARAR